MTKLGKTFLYIAFSFMFLFLSIAYAAYTTTLSVMGEVSAVPSDYDEIVITNVSVANGTTVSEEFNSRVVPTNIKSNITGTEGQVVVYKITAHNYSDTITYIYSGNSCSSEFSDVANKMTISASMDASNTALLPNDLSANCYEGTPVAPGEDFVFYATYKLTDDITNGDILINYNFKPVVYTVTYLNNNQTYAIDCVTNNSVAYNVRDDHPQNGSYAFAGWVNTNAVVVESFPAGNTHDYTLSAKWDNIYLIIFADADGTVIYQEQFTSSSTSLSASGQAIVDAELARLNEAAALKNMTVSWSSYDIASATSDITVKAIYNYAGYLNLVPVYELPDDGIVDYYKVVAVDTLPKNVEVPGDVGGVPVKVIERITNIDGENDWDNYENNVKKITVGEGVETLGWNSLAWTPNLTEVYLPSTIKTMDKNVFSRNDIFGNDKKTLTINYNGTMAEWKAVVANSNSDWYGGLKSGTVIKCIDGYFELKTGLFSDKWNEYKY